MPVDLEMLLSSSNHGFFQYSSDDSTNYCDNAYDRSLSFRRNHCVPSPLVKLQNSFYKKSEHGAFTSPTLYKTENKVTTSPEFYGTRKKKVSFADDKGLKLVEIREIDSPSPPKWADDVITLLIGSRKRSVVKEKKWKLSFDHPPWSDEKLEEALEANMVSLESISIKEGTDDYLTGVIKVKNLAFEKNVFLRVTFDRWLSYEDIPCTYQEPSTTVVKANKYDTFHFNFKISPVATRYEVVEFSVGFRCNGQEYWDNNGGINYRLITEYSKSSPPDLNKNLFP